MKRPFLNINIKTENHLNSKLYIDPSFTSKLQNKDIQTFLEEHSSNNDIKVGARSLSGVIRVDGNKYILRSTPYRSYAERMSTKYEIAIYEHLKRDSDYKQFISNLLYADSYLSNRFKESIFIFEYEEGQLLSDYIQFNARSMNKDAIMKIYDHLVAAIDFLARNNIVHRDIKPDNIYFSFLRNIPLLFDFDISCETDRDCRAYQFTGSPPYATPNSQKLRYQVGFTQSTQTYEYTPIYDKYSLAVMLEKDLSKLASSKDEENELKNYAKHIQIMLLSQNRNEQIKIKSNIRMRRNKTRKIEGGNCAAGTCQIPQTGGSNCRIGVMNPTWGGKKQNPTNISESLLNMSEALMAGAGCGCGGTPIKLPNSELLKGGACPCQAVQPFPTPLGGYRATKRNLKYLKKWKRGESIGFTMRSSLKAKGLIPRSNGKKRVSLKYRS